ncbi:hypothetical protein N204_00735 [Helicobacter pylori UM085]|nr:hypothetical protein N204_00735 [Helicobacter pylori UM085]
MSKKEWLLAPIELVSKALHKNKRLLLNKAFI